MATETLEERKKRLLAEIEKIESEEREMAMRARDELRARITEVVKGALSGFTTDESFLVVLTTGGDVEIKFDVTSRGTSRSSRATGESPVTTDGRGIRVPVVLLGSDGSEKHYTSAQAALSEGVGLNMVGKSAIREAGLTDRDIGKVLKTSSCQYIVVRQRPSSMPLVEALAIAKAMLKATA